MKIILVFLQSEMIGVTADIFGGNEREKVIGDNPTGASRRKHIDVNFHFIRRSIRVREVTIVIFGTEKQHADVFTKSVCRKNRTALMEFLPINCLALLFEVR